MSRYVSNGLMLVVLALLWLPGLLAIAIYIGGQGLVAPPEPLFGVVKAKRVAPSSFDSISSGQFQKEFAASFAEGLPFYPSITRFFNEAQYLLLNETGHREILVGRDGYLLHRIYTSAYCRRDIAASAPAMKAWAKMIAEIQEGFQRRGQKFIYVLTPSKVEYTPEKLPVGYPCASLDRDLYIPEALKQLDLAGVNYIDASAGINTVQQRYGYEPFPKTGIHWTELAALDATNAILGRINIMYGRQVAFPYEVVVSNAPHPTVGEQDFAYLMNLIWLPEPAVTAEISRVESSENNCPPAISVVNVGGSFFTAIARNLVSAPCPPTVRQLSYFVINQVYYYSRGKGAGENLESIDFDLLKTSDVVILEENAGILLKAKHIPSLHEYITTGVLPVVTNAQQ